MIVQVGIRELRSRLSHWLDRVQGGDELLVTERGKPVARVTAVGAQTTLERLVEQGLVTPPRRQKEAIEVRGSPRLRGRPNLSDFVIEQRRGSRF